MNRLLLLTFLAWAGYANAQEPPRPALLAGMDVSSDTDGFRAARARIGGLYPYENPWRYSGVAAQSTRYAQDGYRQDVAGFLGIYRDQRRDTLAGVDIEAGAVRVSGHLRPIGDATWRIVPAAGTGIDMVLAADLVETPAALDRGIGYTFAAAGIEQQLAPRLTATALAGYQSFSDGNARIHGRARLIWLAVPDHGVTAQLRYRQYNTREDDVGGAYFNPSRHQQWLGVAAIRKRHAGWTFSGALGAGQQQSAGGGWQPSYLAEARAEGPFMGDSRLVVRAGYERAQGFIDTDNYAYRSFGISLVIPLR